MAEPLPDAPAENEILIGERNYEAALDIVIASAVRELLIFDEDFSRGAYNSLRRYELLRDFLAGNSNNRLTIILHESAYFTAHCPRLNDLLTVYSHAMTIYVTSEQAKVARDCIVIADQKHYLRRFHVEQARFRYALNDADTASMLNSRFSELLEASNQTVTATKLGL